MMRTRDFLLGAVALASIAACSDDDGVTGPASSEPKAVIRFVHAVPDTGAVDFRFIDKLENLPTFLGVAFRGSSGVYQAVDAGTRPVRIFVNSTDPAAAQQRLVDTTITLNPNARYTLIYTGNARGNRDRLALVEEDFQHPAPSAGSIAVKAIHAAVGTGPVDIAIANGTASAPASNPFTGSVGAIRNASYLSKTAYATVPVRATGTGNLYTFGVAGAGSTTALFSATPNQPGIAAPAGQSHGPQPGVQIAGSVLTAIVVPGAVPGSRAASSSNTSPSVVLLVDKPLD